MICVACFIEFSRAQKSHRKLKNASIFLKFCEIYKNFLLHRKAMLNMFCFTKSAVYLLGPFQRVKFIVHNSDKKAYLCADFRKYFTFGCSSFHDFQTRSKRVRGGKGRDVCRQLSTITNCEFELEQCSALIMTLITSFTLVFEVKFWTSCSPSSSVIIVMQLF